MPFYGALAIVLTVWHLQLQLDVLGSESGGQGHRHITLRHMMQARWRHETASRSCGLPKACNIESTQYDERFRAHASYRKALGIVLIQTTQSYLDQLLVLVSKAIADTMLAVVYHSVNNLVLDLNLPVRPVSTAGENQAVRKIAACDVLGHEIVGTPVHSNPTTVERGIGFNEGYSEFVIVNQLQLILVPAGLTPEIAAAATDSLVVSYSAVYNAVQVTQGDRALIYGISVLGHKALQLAKHFGATVYAVDIRPDARQLTLDRGAEQAFVQDKLTAVTSNGTFHVDTVIDFVASAQSFELSKAAVALADASHGVD
ncbi:hypothetical protein BC628DRAFT_1420958 [Trametes gibbosa]|nr:hypothetical protein BC628DRAFT_1420958 [Trametes gibbosa]